MIDVYKSAFPWAWSDFLGAVKKMQRFAFESTLRISHTTHFMVTYADKFGAYALLWAVNIERISPFLEFVKNIRQEVGKR